METPPALEFGDRQSGTAGPFRLHVLLHGRRHHGDVTALFWRLGLASETLLELIEELTEHWLTPTCALAPAELRQPSSWNESGLSETRSLAPPRNTRVTTGRALPVHGIQRVRERLNHGPMPISYSNAGDKRC